MPELQTGAISILRYIWAQILDDIRVTKLESLVQYALKRLMMNNNKKSEKTFMPKIFLSLGASTLSFLNLYRMRRVIAFYISVEATLNRQILWLRAIF